MNFVDSIKSGITNIITWKGRASRSEFWYFYLFIVIAGIVLAFIGGLLALTPLGGVFALLVGLINLALTVAMISLAVRRVHDLGLSGWWLWISLAPFVVDKNQKASGGSTYLVLFGWMYSIKMYVTAGESTENQYGPNPLA